MAEPTASEHRRAARRTGGNLDAGPRPEPRGPRGNVELAERFRGVHVRYERGGEA